MAERSLPETQRKPGVGVRMLAQLAPRLAGMRGLFHPAHVALIAAVVLSTAVFVAADLPFGQWPVLLLWFSPPLLLVSALADRRLWPAQEVVAWTVQESRADWRKATGTSMPMTQRRFRAWLASAEAAQAPPAYRAIALIQAYRFDEARDALQEIADAASAAEIADRAAAAAQIEFAETAAVNLDAWRSAVSVLPRSEARQHLAAMAIIEAARASADGGPWLDHLRRVHAQLGPFRLSAAGRWAKWSQRLVVPLMVAALVAVLSVALLAVVG